MSADSLPKPVFTCWCGAVGTSEELYSDTLDPCCGGSGTIHCYCGGDQCVCHYHGSVECPGCEDCENLDDDSDYDWSDDVQEE